MSTAHDFAIRSIEAELARTDVTLDDTSDRRRQLMTRLESVIFNPEVDAANLDVKLVKAYQGLLNDHDKNAATGATIKLKNKEVAISDNTSETVGLLLQTIAANGGKYGPPRPGENALEILADIPQLIERKVLDGGGVVLDTELRADPNDLT